MDKFDETDRRAVVDELRSQLRVHLVRVGRRKKWYRDQLGRSYWILGGYGEWHGVPAEMMDTEATSPSDGLLVFGLRERSGLTVFLGPLAPIVAARHRLSRTAASRDYQFTLRKHGRRLSIEGIPSASVAELSEFSFPETAKQNLASQRSAERLLLKMTAAEREELIRILKSKA